MTLTRFPLFVLVPWHILHWIFSRGDFNLCPKENTLWWWNLWDEGASCSTRLGMFYCLLFVWEHLSRGQGGSRGITVNKYIRFLFYVRMRMLEEMFTQCSTINTHVILEEWPQQEFWDRRLFYSGKLYGTHCFNKIKFQLLLFLFEQVGCISILHGNTERLSFSKKWSPSVLYN